MKLLALIISIAFLFSTETGSLKGRLLDGRGKKPLSDASVHLCLKADNMDTFFTAIDFNNTRYAIIYEATTNDDGRFSFEDVKPGKYTLHYEREMDSLGYRQNWTTIDIQPRQQDIALVLPGICNRSKTCPTCKKTDKTVPIVYGFPTDEMWKRAENGLIVLGGCLMDPFCQPEKYCKRDKEYY